MMWWLFTNRKFSYWYALDFIINNENNNNNFFSIIYWMLNSSECAHFIMLDKQVCIIIIFLFSMNSLNFVFCVPRLSLSFLWVEIKRVWIEDLLDGDEMRSS